MSYQSSRGNGDTAKHVFVFIMLLSVDPQNIKTHGLNVLTPEHLFAGFKQLLQTSSSVSRDPEPKHPDTYPALCRHGQPAPAELHTQRRSHTNASSAGTGAGAADSRARCWLQQHSHAHSTPSLHLWCSRGGGGLGEASVCIVGLWQSLITEHHWHTGQLLCCDASNT